MYRESSFYFLTFHSTYINSEAGSIDPKLYFCIYFGAAFTLNTDGKMEQAALPLSAARQRDGGGWHSLVGMGTGGGRWEGVSKGVSLCPRGSTGWHRCLGWGGMCQAPLGCYLKAWLGACGQAKGLVSHLSLWAPGCELAAAPRVTPLCSFALQGER